MRQYLMLHMIAILVAVTVDFAAGDPAWALHPIRLIGKLIGVLESRLCKLNSSCQSAGSDSTGDSKHLRRMQFASGIVLWITVILAVFAVSFIVVAGSYRLNAYMGCVVEAVLSYFILAAGSLRDESMKVYVCLRGSKCSPAGYEDRLSDARSALSMIVGRDTDSLDEAGIVRAAVETVAENTSDGVIAPLIYTALGGPVLGLCYKAVNTMDSMIGYRNEKYEYFGKFAAVADDVANLVPSRISALLMIVGALLLNVTNALYGEGSCPYDPAGAFRMWLRDRYKHKSPNSAQTESVCAGALGVRLGGDSNYGGVTVKKPFIGDDMRPIEACDIKKAVRLMFAAEAVCTAVIFTIISLISISR